MESIHLCRELGELLWLDKWFAEYVLVFLFYGLYRGLSQQLLLAQICIGPMASGQPFVSFVFQAGGQPLPLSFSSQRTFELSGRNLIISSFLWVRSFSEGRPESSGLLESSSLEPMAWSTPSLVFSWSRQSSRESYHTLFSWERLVLVRQVLASSFVVWTLKTEETMQAAETVHASMFWSFRPINCGHNDFSFG